MYLCFLFDVVFFSTFTSPYLLIALVCGVAVGGALAHRLRGRVLLLLGALTFVDRASMGRRWGVGGASIG